MTENQHIILHDTTPVTMHQPELGMLSPAEVASQAKALDEAWTTVTRAMFEGPNGELKSIDPDAHPLDTLGTQVIKELGEDTEASLQDVYLGIRTRLEDAHPDIFAIVAPYIDEAISIDSQTMKLRTQYAEQMATYRDETIGRLASNVNWDRMVGLYTAGEWPEGASVPKDEAL
jgi:hypothetical protein